MSVLKIIPSTARKTDSLFNQIIERLAVGILSGRYQSGQLLPSQNELGDDLAASRTAYREALKFLTAKGLIDARPRLGTRVAARTSWNFLDPDVLLWSLNTNPSDKLVQDLFEVRRVIEPSAARLAAERRNAEQLAALRRAVNSMQTLPAFTEANYRADITFHELILDASQNSALVCMKGLVRTTVLWSMRLHTAHLARDDFEKPLADHVRVFEAIERRDGEQAAAYMTVLVVDAVESTLDRIAKLRGAPVAEPAFASGQISSRALAGITIAPLPGPRLPG